MGMDEQFCRAIYCPHSPAIRYSWRDIRNLKSTAKKDIPKIFQRFGRPAYLTELSFGHYLVSEKVKLEKDIFTNKGRFFNLFHPHHSIKTTSIDILVPLKLNKKDLIIFNLYRKVLADPFLGLLIEELRGKKGMIYDISLNYNFYNDSVHFSYSCDKNKTYENIRAIRQTLENLKQKLGRKINLAKERFTLELDLDWSDISRAVLYYLDEAFLGEFDIAPKDQISKIKSLSSKNLLDFNRHILQKLERDSYIVFSNYGQEVEQKILKEIKIR